MKGFRTSCSFSSPELSLSQGLLYTELLLSNDLCPGLLNTEFGPSGSVLSALEAHKSFPKQPVLPKPIVMHFSSSLAVRRVAIQPAVGYNCPPVRTIHSTAICCSGPRRTFIYALPAQIRKASTSPL